MRSGFNSVSANYTMEQTKRLVRLDPTSQLAFARCEREFFNTNQQGFVPKIQNKYLAFGGAFHIARAMLKRKESLAQAKAAALANYGAATCTKMPPRSMADLSNAIEEWHSNYGVVDPCTPLRNAKGELSVEMPYSQSFYSTEGTDVVLCGVIDELAICEGWSGEIVIVDAKTTSSTNHQEYIKSFLTSPQMCVYSYVVKEEFQLDYYPALILDAVFLSKTAPISCLRNATPMRLDPYIIERVITTFKRSAKRICERLDNGESFGYEFNACSGKYDACPYSTLCPADESVQEMMVDMMFNKREYNPATFNE